MSPSKVDRLSWSLVVYKRDNDGPPPPLAIGLRTLQADNHYAE
ncbi:MAG: hypothetical protein VXZ82_14770 [Planctomycetota bacterium]|nr:hypothetical protein [Planctomycetota bacterium]